eukprot:TRINITY_DN755_c0_g1_i1.p1 TRINITY_DN755_c0_g1~~TRINITY_DN755_c0_g1_i1.p1  ORF type:complete len:407 (-),score=101.91 TRINITY_DN755_c0_g1_i1:487-1638(-)
MLRSLVGSEMCIRDSINAEYGEDLAMRPSALLAFCLLPHAVADSRRVISFNNQSYTSICSAIQPYLTTGIQGQLYQTSPPDCCHNDCRVSANAQPWIALIQRGNCSFVAKIRNAQDLGASAVLVYNHVDNSVIRMGSASTNTGVRIPSVFVGRDTGRELENQSQATGSATVDLVACVGYESDMMFANRYSMLLGGFIVLMISIILAGLLRQMVHRAYNARQMTPPAPADFVVSLPQRTGEEGEDKDCVICLDEFAAGDSIRILPCNHEYHAACVDRWLETQQRHCPLCKIDITHANTEACVAANGSSLPSWWRCLCCRSRQSSAVEHTTTEFELLTTQSDDPTHRPSEDGDQVDLEMSLQDEEDSSKQEDESEQAQLTGRTLP